MIPLIPLAAACRVAFAKTTKGKKYQLPRLLLRLDRDY